MCPPLSVKMGPAPASRRARAMSSPVGSVAITEAYRRLVILGEIRNQAGRALLWSSQAHEGTTITKQHEEEIDRRPWQEVRSCSSVAFVTSWARLLPGAAPLPAEGRDTWSWDCATHHRPGPAPPRRRRPRTHARRGLDRLRGVLRNLRGLSMVLVALALIKLVVMAVFSGRYGWHRDELYNMASGNHLAWGYVDIAP